MKCLSYVLFLGFICNMYNIQANDKIHVKHIREEGGSVHTDFQREHQ